MRAATLGAGLLVAQQVAGKALRDTLFLAEFGVEKLPHAMLASAVVSAALIATLARVARVRSPWHVASASLLASAGLFAAGWALYPVYPAASALLTYLHTSSLTAAAVSVFWVLVTQSFDPYLARGAVPRILIGATLGGALGGLATWQLTGLWAPPELLLLGSLLGLASWIFVGRIEQGRRSPADSAERPPPGAFQHELPYLRVIALLVVLSAVSQAILDYLLSAAALESFGRGPRLLSFFALFQTAVGLSSLLLQLAVSRALLERFGVARVLIVTPLVLLLGVLTPLLVAPLGAAIFLRGADGALGGSLQRSAYEVLFAPLPEAQRRVSKPLLDVGFDRLGTLLGGGLVLGCSAAGAASATPILLLAAAALALARALLAPALEAGYRRALADNLRRGRLGLSGAGVLDRGTVGLLSLSLVGSEREALRQEVERFRASQDQRSPLGAGCELSLAAFNLPAGPELPGNELPGAEDERVNALNELRSGEPERIRAVLQQRRAEPALVSQVVSLLGDDEVARDAADWLSAQRPEPLGAYADGLLAEELEPAARRRVARLLGKSDSERAVQCLLGALATVPPSVRSGVAQALARLAVRRPIARAPLLQAILQTAAQPAEHADDLEQIFALLAAAYPAEPVLPALRALQRGGELRGTALEWLDVLLPHELKLALWPRLLQPGELPRPAQRSPAQLRLALSSRELQPSDLELDA